MPLLHEPNGVTVSSLLRRLEVLEQKASSRLQVTAAELGTDGMLSVTVDGVMYAQADDETESEFCSRLSTASIVVAAPVDVYL